MIRPLIRWLAGRNRGQELVEYALTLPILLLFVLGIMEFGVAVFAYNSIANAAREGARVGAVAQGTQQEVEQVVTDAAIGRTGGLRLTPANVTVNFEELDSEDDPELDRDAVKVTVIYTHALITGRFLQTVGSDATLDLRSVATMYREVPRSYD